MKHETQKQHKPKIVSTRH